MPPLSLRTKQRRRYATVRSSLVSKFAPASNGGARALLGAVKLPTGPTHTQRSRRKSNIREKRRSEESKKKGSWGISEARGKFITYLDGPRPHVRHEHDVRVRDEARVHLGLLLVDVQARGCDMAALERLYQRVLVHDGPSCRVDDDDTLLHLGELRCRDDVACVFLIILK